MVWCIGSIEGAYIAGYVVVSILVLLDIYCLVPFPSARLQKERTLFLNYVSRSHSWVCVFILRPLFLLSQGRNEAILEKRFSWLRALLPTQDLMKVVRVGKVLCKGQEPILILAQYAVARLTLNCTCSFLKSAAPKALMGSVC